MRKVILVAIAIIALNASADAQMYQSRTNRPVQTTITTQSALNAYPFATVPGFRVVTNRNFAHYVSETGPEHFVITREEYERRRDYEREVKEIQRQRERIKRDAERLGKELSQIFK